MDGILDLGVYITTAIKCGKTGYSISSKTIENCSSLLESEIYLLPDVKAILLMGETAIKSMNYIAKRKTGKRIVPSGSTYKIRKSYYFYNDVRVFPTYLQTGRSYQIEKSKRKMIAEDIVVDVFDCQGARSQQVKTVMLNNPNPQLRAWAQNDNSQGQPDATRLEKAREFAKETMKKVGC